MAQLVQLLTLDFGLGHDLTICGTEPCSQLRADNRTCLGFSRSLRIKGNPNKNDSDVTSHLPKTVSKTKKQSVKM